MHRVVNQRYVYCFVDPDFGVEIVFKNEKTTEQGVVDFGIGNLGTLQTLVLGVKENSYRACLFLHFFGDEKIIAFKGSIDLYFHPLITEFF